MTEMGAEVTLQKVAEAAGRQERIALVVLGMHRSGTSALTRVISLLGADLPGQLLPEGPDNVTGYWESPSIVRFNERLLAQAATSWDDWRRVPLEALDAMARLDARKELCAILAAEFSASPCFVLKDPRICRLASLYMEALAEMRVCARFVLPIRNPLSVARSLAARNGTTEGFAGLVWLRHLLDAEAATRGSFRAFVTYEALLDDWRATALSLVRALQIAWPRSPGVAAPDIEAFLRRDLNHHGQSHRDTSGEPDLPLWVEDAYRAAMQLAADPNNSAALVRLDDIRSEFDRSARIFGAAVFPELRWREAATTAKPATGESEIAELRTQAAAMADRVAKLTDEVGAARHDLALVYASKSWRFTAPLRRLRFTLARGFYRLRNLARRLQVTQPLVHRLAHVGRTVAKTIVSTAPPQNPAYKNFDDYLRHSLLDPIVRAPFSEADKRCFAVMDNIARYLCRVSSQSKAHPLVTVIMPVYNREHVVQTAIQSVLHQTYRNFELIIVDDHSSDGTLSRVRALDDPRVRVVALTSRSGAAGARNAALAASRGNLFAYLDSDNTWSETFLDAMVGAFELLPDADGAYCAQFLYRSNHPKPMAVRFGSANLSLLANINYIDMNCFMHRRRALKNVSGFDANLRRFIDWDFILRISEIGLIYSIPAILSNYSFSKADNTITDDANLYHHIHAVRINHKGRSSRRTSAQSTLARPVSIIIPSYQALADLRDCVASIQTY